MSRRLRALMLAGGLAAALAAPGTALGAFGALDLGFGTGGIAQATFGETSEAGAVVRLADGRLVVAGRQAASGREHVLLARYDGGHGTLDPTFGLGGSVLDQFGTSPDAPQHASALAVQGDGKLLVAGNAGDSWFLARYLPGGKRDLPFAGGGVSLSPHGPGVTAPSGVAEPAAIAVQKDGKIVVVGTLTDPFQPDQSQVILARYAASGQLDPSFGTGGSFVHQFGVGSPGTSASSRAVALALLPDGRILVAGEATDRRGGTVALLGRYQAGGRLDGTFGLGGRVAVQLGAPGPRSPQTQVSGLLLRLNGSAVIAGGATDAAGTPGVLLAAFDGVGKLLPGFGRGGVVRAQYGIPANARDGVASAALTLSTDAPGNLLVGGVVARPDTAANPTKDVIALRYGAAGQADCRARATPLRSRGRLDDRVLALDAAVLRPTGGLVLVGGFPRTRRQVLLAALQGGVGGPAPRVAAATGPAGRSRGRVTLAGVGDPSCRSARYRFEYGHTRHYSRHTSLRALSARFGPQTVAATLPRRGSRGRLHYRLVMVSGGRSVRGHDAVLR